MLTVKITTYIRRSCFISYRHAETDLAFYM